jgi:hypothetical protein
VTAENRAADVQMRPAERGQHRAHVIAELLMASTAAIAAPTGLALEDFDLTAQITGHPVEWLYQ